MFALDDSADPRVGRRLEERLTIVGVLGRGGMGTVYRAVQHSMEREVAVKILSPSDGDADGARAIARTAREALAASRLQHPHVVTVFDVRGLDGREPYLVMERLVGQTLRQALVGHDRLPPKRAAQVGAQVADALAAAHDQGLVHRDLKPDNLFLTTASDGGVHVKVLDFGLARVERPTGHTTEAGLPAGTPLYMAPEQALGQAPTPASDLYALGATLYEMLTGAAPFASEPLVPLLLAKVSRVPARPVVPGLPEPLVDLVMTLLDRAPERRRDARRVRVALFAIASETSETVASREAPALLAVNTETWPALRTASGIAEASVTADPPPSWAVTGGDVVGAVRPRTRWPLAAAVVFVVAALGWLMTPRSAAEVSAEPRVAASAGFEGPTAREAESRTARSERRGTDLVLAAREVLAPAAVRPPELATPAPMRPPTPLRRRPAVRLRTAAPTAPSEPAGPLIKE